MSLLASWLSSPPPDAAIEIAPERVSAAALSRGIGLPCSLRGEALPKGAVIASLAAHNIIDRQAVAAAVGAVSAA
jgi:hypothetical protein